MPTCKKLYCAYILLIFVGIVSCICVYNAITIKIDGFYYKSVIDLLYGNIGQGYDNDRRVLFFCGVIGSHSLFLLLGGIVNFFLKKKLTTTLINIVFLGLVLSLNFAFLLLVFAGFGAADIWWLLAAVLISSLIVSLAQISLWRLLYIKSKVKHLIVLIIVNIVIYWVTFIYTSVANNIRHGYLISLPMLFNICFLINSIVSFWLYARAKETAR